MFENIEKRTKSVESVAKAIIFYISAAENEEDKQEGILILDSFKEKLDKMDQELQEKRTVIDMCSKLIAERKEAIEKFKKDNMK